MTPTTLIPIFILTIVVVIAGVITTNTSTSTKNSRKYTYRAKPYLMTKRESDFFKKLDHIFHTKCYIFPQVHLSSLLKHEIRGQSWKGAFSHINGKSVDYVFCDRATLKTICVVELDDSTHDRQDRIERDEEVERILKTAHIPIIRFKHPEAMTNQAIVDRFAEVLKSSKP